MDLAEEVGLASGREVEWDSVSAAVPLLGPTSAWEEAVYRDAATSLAARVTLDISRPESVRFDMGLTAVLSAERMKSIICGRKPRQLEPGWMKSSPECET